MEILDNKIKEWLNIDSSYDSIYGDSYGDEDDYDFDFDPGSGEGSGSGSGDGSGYGYGDGYGDGDGAGSGEGSGSGNGYGLKSINKQKIFLIDNTQTIIKSIHNNIARGYILNNDFTLKKCFVAKGQNKFAHGETIKKALKDLEEKIMEDIDTEEVIGKFRQKFENNKKYKVKEFYDWHHYLTGSCEMGRNSFAKNNNIDIEKGKMTVQEFIELTENSYNGEIIKELKQYYIEK